MSRLIAIFLLAAASAAIAAEAPDSGRKRLSGAEAVVRVLNSRSSGDTEGYEEAARIIAEDAEKGLPLQQFVLALVSAFDDAPAAAKIGRDRRQRYLDENRERIRDLAEKRGNPLAWYLLSIEKNDFGMLTKAAEGGNVQALNALASYRLASAIHERDQQVERGEEPAPDPRFKEAYDLFRKAAARGDGNALCNLGLCLANGFGCEENMKRAFTSFRLAAERGHAEAMDHLSGCYESGSGCEVSAVESMVWKLRSRAATGDKAAKRWLKANGK